MKIILLAQGYEAIVDDEDYEELSKYKWYISGIEDGYPSVMRSGFILMSRQIMNAPAHLEVDHKDGNRLDMRRFNLRICTRSQNCHNMKKKEKGKTSSKYKGVSLLRYNKKWYAQLEIQDILGRRMRVCLGAFTVEEEAAEAYDEAARCYHGEFARLNFPEEGEQSCL